MLKRAIGVRSIRPGRASEPIAPIVIDYNISLAEHAVPEWQETLDALQTLAEVGVEAPIGYAGMTWGVGTGLMLTAIEPGSQ